MKANALRTQNQGSWGNVIGESNLYIAIKMTKEVANNSTKTELPLPIKGFIQ